jgi:tetratricopeptide (TPR) repeat protein
MAKKGFFLIFILFLFYNNNIFCKNNFDRDFYNFCADVQQKVYNEDFEGAINILNQKITENPYDSRYRFLLSAAYYWRSFVFENDRQALDNFIENIDKAIDLSNYEVEKNPKNAGSLFILGISYGYKGIYYLQEKSMFSAIKNASKGIDFINTALSLDPSLIDCYYGLGLYNYNAGKASFFVRLLLPIFFKSADKETGIKYLELTHEKGNLSKFQATFDLAQVYEKEGDFSKSLLYLKELAGKFPGSSVFNILLMMNYYNYQKDYNEVIKMGTLLINEGSESGLRKKRFGGYALICLAEAYYNISDYKNALVNFEKCLTFNISNDYIEHAKIKISEIKNGIIRSFK